MNKIKSLLFVLIIMTISFITIGSASATSFPDTGGRVQYFYDSAKKELTIRGQNAPTEHAYVSGNFTKASDWPWHSLRNEIEKVTFTTGTNGAGVGFSGVANFMFADMPNLKTVDLSGMQEIQASGLARMFSNCPKLEKVDMSMLTTDGSLNNLQNMFRDSGVKEVIMPSGANFTLREDAQLAGMFQNTKNLESFTWGDVDVTEAKTFKDMFKDSGVKELDLSGFGKLTNVTTMQDMLKNCTNLEKLNISGLDNSIIGPTNNKHSVTSGQPGYISDREVAKQIGAKEFARELGLDTCTSLKEMDATNSKVWMVFNNRGLPGNEYYDAANEANTLFFTKNKFTINGVAINDERDYIDVITDRESNNMPTLSGTSQMADKSTNVNELNNLNTNGSGFLAPGIYKISDSPFDSLKSIEDPETYYAIYYLGTVRPEVNLVDDHNGDIILTTGSENLHYLTTRNMTKDEWGTGTKTIPFKAVITYPDAAIDVNGKKHDLVITINSVTFTDLDKIPSYSSFNGNREHDDNNYWDKNSVDTTQFYRTILQATKVDGIILQNYARVGNPEAPWTYTGILTGGAGTTIDYNVKIDKANPNTTFTLYVDDLDVAAAQNWNRPNKDADYDNLPIENVTYGLGGESIEFVSGANISDVKFAEKTGLTTSGNKVISTGSDPSTSWSEFKVAAKADGEGSSFKWITGISCNSYMLLKTDPRPLSSISFEPVSKKLIGGTLAKDQFEFTLTPDSSVENNKATGSAITKTNDENGHIDFGFVFDDPQITIDGNDYYPGTNDDSTQDQNTHGEGTHNKYIYAWTVEETDGGDPDIIYDLGPKKLKVIISTPENDAEMKKGIKAEIYVDDVLTKTVWSNDVKNNKYVEGLVFKNKQIQKYDLTITKEVTGDLASKDDEFEYAIKLTYENTPVTGDLKVEIDGKEETMNVTDNLTLKLKHGQKAVIKALKETTEYEIVEKDTDYKESFKITSDNKVVKESAGNKAVSKLDNNHTVSFVNEKTSIPQTDVINNIKPIVMLSLLAIFGCFDVVLISKKLKLKH